MNKTRTNSPKHKLKIKPHAAALRQQLAAIPAPGIAEMDFGSSNWRPSSRFFLYSGEKLGRTFSVRTHKGKTFVARLA
jgi:hypothetical protein